MTNVLCLWWRRGAVAQPPTILYFSEVAENRITMNEKEHSLCCGSAVALSTCCAAVPGCLSAVMLSPPPLTRTPAHGWEAFPPFICDIDRSESEMFNAVRIGINWQNNDI